MELTFYKYDPVTFAYTESETSEGQPDNSTQWAPPECPEGLHPYFDGLGWVKSWAPEDMTAERIKVMQLAVAARELKRALARLNSGISPEEVSTYSQQYADARMFLDTNQRPVFLEALARARSQDLADFALKVIDKAESYNVEKARILATYQIKVKAIEADEAPVLTQELLQQSSMI